MGVGAEKRQCLSPAFFFVLEKGSKSAGNAVIPTYPTHWSHGLQYLRYKRPMFAFVGESGYTRHPSPEPRTQRLTRRNRWRFGWGWYHYPRSVPHVSETLRGRGLKRQTLPLLGLGRGCSQRTQRAFGTAMRLCASLSRGVGPGGLRDLFSFLSKLRLVCPVPDTSFGSPDAPACAVPVQAASQLVPFRLGVQWFSVETGRIFCYNFGKRVT